MFPKIHINLPSDFPKALVFIVPILLILLLGFISWGATALIIKGICWCFKLDFSLRIATGIWLILFLVSSLFNKNRSND